MTPSPTNNKKKKKKKQRQKRDRERKAKTEKRKEEGKRTQIDQQSPEHSVQLYKLKQTAAKSNNELYYSEIKGSAFNPSPAPRFASVP